MREWKVFLFVLWLLVGFFACTPDAPHQNPVDPIYQNFAGKGLVLSGQTLQKKVPHFPIESCTVFILPENKFTNTANDGRFSFSGLQRVPHRLLFYKTNIDSTWIDLPTDSLTDDEIIIYLNGRPTIRAVSIYSEYIDQWWPDPVAFLNAELIADDPDGINDLADIFLTIGGDSSKYNFTATARPDSFSLRLDQLALPGQNIVSLVGEKIYIHLRDSSGSNILSGPHQLVRVMNKSPMPVSPTALETTAPRPTLSWQSYFAAFPFTFEISVFHVSAGIPVRLFYRRSLVPEQTQFTFPDSLSSGTYFWTVGVRDQFHDLIRSKEASFIIP